MQNKKTLPLLFAVLILLSSFIPVTSGQFKDPTACDLFAENNTDVTLALVHFNSTLDDVRFFNIDPGGTQGGVLQFDDQIPVTITVNFVGPIPRDAIARIYHRGSQNQVATINIAAGASGGGARIYPPLGSDAFIVRVYWV